MCHRCLRSTVARKWRVVCSGCVDQAYFCSEDCRTKSERVHVSGGECGALLHWRATLKRAARDPKSDHHKQDHLHYLVRICIAAGAGWVASAVPNDIDQDHGPDAGVDRDHATAGIARDRNQEAVADGDASLAAALADVSLLPTAPLLPGTLADVDRMMDRRDALTANDWAGHQYVVDAALDCLAAALHLRETVSPADVAGWLRTSAAGPLGSVGTPPAGPPTLAALAAVVIEVLHRVRCNAFTVVNEEGDRLGAAVFPLASLFNHSCVPTCEFVYTVR